MDWFAICSSLGLLNFIPDEKYYRILYKRKLEKKLDLDNPVTFNQKLQWLKLHDRNPEYTRYSDKYEVKKLVAEIVGEEYVIPTIGVWNSVKDIDIDKLPDKFVLKCTHDSGGVAICKDKKTFDWTKNKIKLSICQKRDYYLSGREASYKGIPRRIIAEQFMDDNGNDLMDYKFYVFSGKAYCVHVDYDRFTDHKRSFYDMDWNYLPFTTKYPTDPNHEIEKPECFDELKELVEKLAHAIGDPAQVRIDFYVINGKPYFGEYTFFHGSGCERFMPEEWGKTLGDMIDLSRAYDQRSL